MARHISAGCRCAQSDIGGSIHNLYPKTYPNLPLQIPLTGLYLFIHASLFRVKIVANIRLNLLICTHFALIQRRLVIRITQGVPKSPPTLDAVSATLTASGLSGVFDPSIFTSRKKDANSDFRPSDLVRTRKTAFLKRALRFRSLSQS